MAFNRNHLKVISIIQVIICGVFFTLGLADGLGVRFAYSMTFIPCWLAILVSKKVRKLFLQVKVRGRI